MDAKWLWLRSETGGCQQVCFVWTHILIPPLYVRAREGRLRVDALHSPFGFILDAKLTSWSCSRCRMTQTTSGPQWFNHFTVCVRCTNLWGLFDSCFYWHDLSSSNGSSHSAITPTRLIPQSWMNDFSEKIHLKATCRVAIRTDEFLNKISFSIRLLLICLFRRRPLKDPHPDEGFFF